MYYYLYTVDTCSFHQIVMQRIFQTHPESIGQLTVAVLDGSVSGIDMLTLLT